MSKATSKITSQFKNTFVRTKGKDTTELQKAYFQMGFRWPGTTTRHRKVVIDSYSYLRVDENYELFYATDEETPAVFPWCKNSREVSWESVIEAAEQVRNIKREESKASKKRRAQRKWGATATKRTTEVCPVRRNVVVAVKLEDGEVSTDRAGVYDWTTAKDGYTDRDIASYKVLNPNKKVVTQDEMVADIVASAGGREIIAPVDKDGFIAWNGGDCPVPAGTRIDVKYRNSTSHSTAFNMPAGTPGVSCYAFWRHDGAANDIVAYRVCPTVTPAKQPDVFVEVPEVEPTALDTNPKKQYGVQSIPLSMWSNLASAYGALAFYNGALKYGKANYANTKVEASIYVDAIKRHLAAWEAGEEFDPADGVPNLGGVLANVAILLESRAAGMLIDDRPKQSGYLIEREALKGHVKSLNALHEGKNPKHYTMGATE